MRQAGIIPDASQADRFSNYLATLGISGRVEKTDQGYIIWVHDDLHWQQSREELASFLADPNAERYQVARKSAEALRREQQRREEQYQQKVVDIRRRWQPRTAGRFPLTWILIAACVVVSLGTNYGQSAWANRWLYMIPVLSSQEGQFWYPTLGLHAIWHGQIWRLVSPIFPHVGGLWHLFFNMYWTYQFGALIETRRGTLRFLGVVLITAICSNVAQYVSMTQFEGVPPIFGGISGVGFGLFGYIWMKSRFDPGAGIYIDRSTVMWFLVWLVLCYTGVLRSLFGITVANAAHTAGIISGMALGYASVLWIKMVRAISG